MPSVQQPSRMGGLGMGHIQTQPQHRQKFQFTHPVRNPTSQGISSQGMVSQGITSQGMPSQQLPNQMMAPGGVMLPNHQAVLVSGEEPLTLDMLTAATHDQQKQMLGERLYKLIEPMNQELAGKLTGMLLECDTEECLHMLVDKKSLGKKVKEAVTVLLAHKKKMETEKKEQKN